MIHTVFSDDGKNVAEVVRDWVTVLSLIGGAIWTIFVLQDPLKKQHELQLLRMQVEQASSVQIDMEAETIGETATEGVYIIAYVSITNRALETLRIATDKPTLFIRDENKELIKQLHMTEHGESVSIVENLVLQPNGQEKISFSFRVPKSGLYSVTFSIPISAAQWASTKYDLPGFWSRQRFVLVK